MPWFIENYLAAWVTVLGFLVIMCPLIAMSHPEWFRHRPRYVNGAPELADDQPEYEEWPDFREPERLVLDRPYIPVAYVEPDQAYELDYAAHQTATTSLDSEFGIDDDQEDDDQAQELLDILDRMPVIAEPKETPSVVVPVYAPIQAQSESNKKKRRKEYEFKIGTIGGVIYKFSLGHILLVKRTRGGKSNIVAIIIDHAHRQGMEVWYADVNYKPQSEDGLNTKPLIDQCSQVAIDPSGEKQYVLLDSALKLIDQRTVEGQAPGHDGYFPPVLVVLEEAKSFQDKLALLEELDDRFKGIAKRSGRLLSAIISTGAGVNVNIMVVSQDAQNGTLNMTRGSVNNFEVRIFHPVTDPKSLVNLLPKGYDQKHHPLPKPKEYQLESTTSRPWYVVSEDSTGGEKVVMVDVPRVGNRDIALCLANMPKKAPLGYAIATAVPTSAAELWPIISQEENEMHIPYMQESHSKPEEGLFQIAPIIQAEPEGKPMYSKRHIKVAFYLRDHPEATQTDVAKAVWGRADGPYNQRAKKYMEEVSGLVSWTPPQNENDEDEDS